MIASPTLRLPFALPFALPVVLTLALGATACRQVAELPGSAPAAPATANPETRKGPAAPPWLGSEAAVFEHVQQVFDQAGFPEVRTAVFKVSDEVPLPFYRTADRTLFIPPFTDGAARMRERLARMSATRFAGALTFIDEFESDKAAYDAFRAFMVVAVAHELSHHVQFLRKGAAAPTPADAYDTESDAIEFEQAFLAAEIAAQRAPDEWRAHYRQGVIALRDAIPRFAIEALPDDATELRQSFARAYLTYGLGESRSGAGVNPELAAASTVYAGYTQRRITLLTKGARSLADLAKAEADRRAAAAATTKPAATP